MHYAIMRETNNSMNIFRIIWRTIKGMGTLNSGQLASSLSFNVFFTIAPIIFLSLAVAGLIIDIGSFQEYLIVTVKSYTSPEVTSFFTSLLETMTNQSVNISAIIVGSGTVFLGLMGVTSSIMTIFHDVWHDPDDDTLLDSVKRSMVAYAVIVILGFLLLGTMVVSAMIEVSLHYFNSYIPFGSFILAYTNVVLILVILFALFALLFKFSPPKIVPWNHVIFPALVTSVLIYFVRYVLEIYFGYGGFSSVYGAASTLVIVLVWIQTQGYIIIFGAKMSEVSYKLSKQKK